MSQVLTPVVYPDSDGMPLADNTRQFQWIATLKGNLDVLFADRADVFIAGDLLWYPVETQPEVRIAPDVLAAFGRPKGHRGSYKQWEEGGAPLTVVFEVLSPGNTVTEMTDKYLFYEEHGVEEYYVYDPDDNYLEVYQRQGTRLRRIRPAHGFVSPRLKIRFHRSPGSAMIVYHPNGQPFLTFEELEEERARQQLRAESAERDRYQARP